MISERRLMMMAGAASVIAYGAPAAAQPQANMHYDMQSQDLGAALRQVGRVAGVEVLFVPGDVVGITAPALQGDLTLGQALDRLLSKTGLVASYANGAVIIRGRSSGPQSDAADAVEPDTDIVVTGSRIRGATSASPVIAVTQAQMRDAGQSNLGDVVRSIPQSFGGGQIRALDRTCHPAAASTSAAHRPLTCAVSAATQR